jgi:hypothetical protein
MTKEEFIIGYCERSHMPRADFDVMLVALPCSCGVPECNGWAAIGNDPWTIKTHMDFNQ